MSSIKLISADENHPVDLTGFKNHIGFTVADTGRDTQFALLIGAAAADAEHYSGLRFMPAIYEERFAAFETPIYLDKNPITGINSVKYFNATNEEITMVSGTDYYFDIEAKPAELHFINTPGTYNKRADAVVINYGAGYTTAADVPDDIKAAILLAAANLYFNPGDAVRNLPTASKSLLRNYRTYSG